MKVFTAQEVDSIAQDLDVGLLVYIHQKTGEVITVIDRNSPFYDDSDDIWEEAFEKLDANLLDYIQIESLTTHRAFQIMEDFAREEASNHQLSVRLLNALDRRKPFRNFKNIIDDSKDRAAWFAYHRERSAADVLRQLKRNVYRSEEEE